VLAAEEAVLEKFQFFLDLLLVLESVVNAFLALGALHPHEIIL
jgi:hypothetical protein